MKRKDQKRISWFENAAIISICNFLATSIAFITSIILARYLGPEGRGAYGVIMATIIMLPTMLNFGLNAAAPHYISTGKMRLERLCRSLFVICIVTSILPICILYACYAGLPLQLLPAKTTLLVFVAVSILLFSGMFQTFMHQLLIGFEDFSLFSYIRLSSNIFYVLYLAAKTIASGEMTLEYVVIGLVIKDFLLQTAFILRLRRYWPSNPESGFLSWPEMRKLYSYSFRAYFANLVQSFNYKLDIYIVNYFHGLAATGIYCVAVSIAQILNVIPGAVASVAFPRTGSQGNSEEHLKSLTVGCRTITLLTVICSLALIAAFPYVLVPLLGDKFQPSYYPFLGLLVGITVFAPTRILTAFLAGRGKPELNLIGSVAGVIVTILMDLILIPKFGGVGAAIATSLSYSITAVIAILFFKRNTGLTLNEIMVIKKSDVSYLIDRIKLVFASKIRTKQ